LVALGVRGMRGAAVNRTEERKSENRK